jgi:folate-dependent phosphoribosylglycinamide formyltransferase PurN
MATSEVKLSRPMRVVVFTSGPFLEPGIQQFLCRVDDNPEIELLACIGQAKISSRQGVYKELWKRRGMLALPLLLARFSQEVWKNIRDPRGQKALKNHLEALKGRIQFVPDIHAPEVLDQVYRLAPDLGLIYGSPILKPKLFEIPAFGTLGIHHGKVPQYRGKKTMFWAMYNGEKTAGVTIQKINAGLDTGLVVKAGEVPIDQRTPSAVWKDLNELGLQLYIQAILDVKHGRANFCPQEGQKGKLYTDPTAGEILELWRRILLRKVTSTGGVSSIDP